MERPDVFELRPLLYPALPVDSNINPTSPAALSRSLRCAEPFGAHLYLGSSDGQVFCYIATGASRTAVEGSPQEEHSRTAVKTALPPDLHDFRHVGTRSISSKPIERIVILSALGVAIVQSESTLTFHELPSFLPIPQQVLPHIKGVAAVALDDYEALCTSSRLDAEGLASLCIIRRKQIMLVKLSKDTWRVLKEIPLTGGATNARRFADWLCISTTSEYNVVNLKEATLSSVGLPISQTTEAPSASSRPSIVSVPIADTNPARCEFLITSHSDELTLGVFISQEGEPTARLLEWPSHPRMLTSEHPYIHALLRNDTVEVHNLNTLEKVQTVHLPTPLEPRTLSNATSQLELTEEGDQSSMSLVKIRIHANGQRERLTTERTSSWRDRVLQERQGRSHVLMIGKNVVQGMFRTKILDSAIRALHRGDLKRAQYLTDVAWEQRSASEEQDLERLELEYMNQVLAIDSLRFLQFEKARVYMLRGRMDYRVILGFFPSLYSKALDDVEEVEMFTSVANAIDRVPNLERFPQDNLELNYCPPLDFASNSTLQKLHASLSKRIESMFETLFDALRNDRSLMNDDHARVALDTVQALMLVRRRDTDALSRFLADAATRCKTNVIEPLLADVGCFAHLAKLHESRKEWAAALDLQTRLLDGDLTDDHFSGTTQGVAEMLQKCDDADLIHKYSIWLVQRDATAGVKLLTKGRTGAGVGASVAGAGRSDQETLEELRAIDAKAATAFLEAIALTRKQQDAHAHGELVGFLLNSIRTVLHDDVARQAMESITKDFVEGEFAESFVAHLALHASSEAACAQAVIDRLKLMALLQGSSVLDVDQLVTELEQEPLLSYERAILLGKMRKDAMALTILAIEMRDSNSAETYCTQDGRPVSLIVLQNVDVADVKVYASFVARSIRRHAANTGVQPSGRNADHLALLKTLLSVYIQQTDTDNEFQVATTHLLNTQAMHLSAQDILSTVPSSWTVRTLETFLARSLRREMHRANEGHIQRAAALAQNLEAAETLWSKRRGLGGVIEDGTAGDGDDDDDEQKRDLGGGIDGAIDALEQSSGGQDDLGRALVEKVQAEYEKAGIDAEKEEQDVF